MVYEYETPTVPVGKGFVLVICNAGGRTMLTVKGALVLVDICPQYSGTAIGCEDTIN